MAPTRLNTWRAPPILDFSPFYSNDAAAKKKLVDDVRDCCLHNGFFQIVGHQVPEQVQEGVLKWCENFFDMPVEEKTRVSKGEFFLCIAAMGLHCRKNWKSISCFF